MMIATWSTFSATAVLWIQRWMPNFLRTAMTTPMVSVNATSTPMTSDTSESMLALVPRNPRAFI